MCASDEGYSATSYQKQQKLHVNIKKKTKEKHCKEYSSNQNLKLLFLTNKIEDKNAHKTRIKQN